MKWYVLEHTDGEGRRHYYTWSEDDLNEVPSRRGRPGCHSEVAGVFDTEEEALAAFRRWSDEAGT